MSGFGIAFPLKVILLSLLPFYILRAYADEESQKKLEVKVYYEALCPFSMNFIKDQLEPSMSQKGRLNYTDLKFIPYGHARHDNDSKTRHNILKCQHGQKECELNAEHACIIENNTEKEAFDMITCLMRGKDTDIDKCAAEYGINVDSAKKCHATRPIEDILAKYGNDTIPLEPFAIPKIVVDGVYNSNEAKDIYHNFDSVFCRHYKSKFDIALTGC